MQSSLTVATFSRQKHLLTAYINTIDIQNFFACVFEELNEFVVVIVYAEMGI